MGNSIMTAIVGFLVQKMMGGLGQGGGGGIGSMLSGIVGGDSGSSGSGSGGIGSILSGLGGLNQDHELVRTCTAKCWYTRSRAGQTIYTTRS